MDVIRHSHVTTFQQGDVVIEQGQKALKYAHQYHTKLRITQSTNISTVTSLRALERLSLLTTPDRRCPFLMNGRPRCECTGDIVSMLT